MPRGAGAVVEPPPIVDLIVFNCSQRKKNSLGEKKMYKYTMDIKANLKLESV